MSYSLLYFLPDALMLSGTPGLGTKVVWKLGLALLGRDRPNMQKTEMGQASAKSRWRIREMHYRTFKSRFTHTNL